jgi:hypothetical protein
MSNGQIGTTPITEGSQLVPGSYYLSPSGNSQLIFQDDGNLVFYVSPGPNQVVRWASNTSGPKCQYARLISGNFGIYDDSGNTIWATNTQGSQQSVLTIDESFVDDFELKIIDQSDNKILWMVPGGPC